ncbi:DsbA family oxidoreductase [uncultured Hymenobacter sp.]|uniref:DsbA family oxidoreductase n=1 Tax=uncultured Hymenobacter sp. TaxID=170016 RepID=UPI0035CA4703
MKIEIWSDIVCPFCYIGKRRLEAALADFPHRDQVEIQWRSFELTPDYQPVPGRDVYASLADKKGISRSQSKQMHDQMAASAAQVGLAYNFAQAVPTNSFLSHQLLHLATKHGVNDAAKERLFRAYYTEGRDLNDLDTLVQLATEVGLSAEESREVLQAGTYAEAVRYDEYQAQQVGVRGVPFFVFEDKYAVSGAQPAELFGQVLDTVWREANPLVAVGAEGAACGPDGCD